MRFTPIRQQPFRLPTISEARLRIAELSSRQFVLGAKAFPAAHWLALRGFGPNVLVGSGAQLQRLLERMDLRTVDLSSVDHAVFALTELGDKPISDVLRLGLWQRLGVPVYELYVGPGGNLLARECEAQEGWHIEANAQFVPDANQLWFRTRQGLLPTGLAYELDARPCACGRPGLRIVHPGYVAEGSSAPLAAAMA